MNNHLNLFISYSHDDEQYITQFIKHISQLKENHLIEDWYDRKIPKGDDWDHVIDTNLNNSDIICMFISSHFLSSEACKKELNIALKLRQEKDVTVIPIILSHCGWKDNVDISKLQATPKDGKPIVDFANLDDALHMVYEDLKLCIENINKIKNIKFSNNFEDFLQDCEMLSYAHHNKEKININDIFIYPDLIHLNKKDKTINKDIIINSEKLLNNFIEYSNILICGENQSGKTTLSKVLIQYLKDKKFIPIYIDCKEYNFQGFFTNKLEILYKKQYEGCDFKIIEKKIIPILEDFQYLDDKSKNKAIKSINDFTYKIIIADDIFSLKFEDSSLLENFERFSIKELSPKLRNSLIKTWSNINRNQQNEYNQIYKEIDERTDLVDSSLGKILGSGIMPAYPFFILSIISNYNSIKNNINSDITSQGYCYETLIVIYLNKEGVKNDDIDTYMNFLVELSYFFYQKNKNEISYSEFNEFIEYYSNKFNLPVKTETLIKTLEKTRIINFSSLGSYRFSYSYIYYFFVAKFLSENLRENKTSNNLIKNTIEYIAKNLHVNSNAYIFIFLTHHSKDPSIIDEILTNAMVLFIPYEDAKLSKKEMKFLDSNLDFIPNALLPEKNNPEKNRNIILEQKHLSEEEHIEYETSETQEFEENETNESFSELRRAVKTVEVLGNIIKNRAGSLEKERIILIFEEAMKVYLRIISSFFQSIQHEEVQELLINHIKYSIEKNKNYKTYDENSITSEDISKSIFWSINFGVIYAFINKIIHSLGSSKLTNIIEKVCDKNDSPISFLIKQGILMWYEKSINKSQIQEISEFVKRKDFSNTADMILKYQIVEHCKMHHITEKDKQIIESRLNINKRKLIKLD